MLLSKESKEDDPKKQQWAHEGSYNQLYPEKNWKWLEVKKL